MNEQTQLKVRTNVPDTGITMQGGALNYLEDASSGVLVVGSGTIDLPYTGVTTAIQGLGIIYFQPVDSKGIIHYSFSGVTVTAAYISVNYNQVWSGVGEVDDRFNVEINDIITIILPRNKNIIIYFEPVYDTVYNYEYLDLYSDIPIKINKSFAEIQDISKKNSDYSIGLKLPGTKKNNKFFENFFNADNVSYNFDPRKRIPCNILINDEQQFVGFLKLNKINVKETSYEYDVTLYSSVGDLISGIGNNPLSDLNFKDSDYYFNHQFNADNITASWIDTPNTRTDEPRMYMYPVIHNGYEYGDDNAVNTGTLTSTDYTDITRYYNVTNPVYTYETAQDAYDVGVEEYRINSPQSGIVENQLKPAISYWGLIQLMFKTYGYSIKSDFMNTPWAKMLYLYGPFSSDKSKFTYKIPPAETFTKDQVDVVYAATGELEWFFWPCPGVELYINVYRTYVFSVVKKGTNIPCYCSDQLTIAMDWKQDLGVGSLNYFTSYTIIEPNEPSAEITQWVHRWDDSGGCPWVEQTTTFLDFNQEESNVIVSLRPLAYELTDDSDYHTIKSGDYVNFSLVLDKDIKQIDILSSFMKKFNLVVYPNPENESEMIIEPYDFHIGSGNIYDWTDKLSVDKGYSIEPANNIVDNVIKLTDTKGNDSGNKTYQERFDKIYGENIRTNPTDFKSKIREIKTKYSPTVYRDWDSYIRYPLAVNYIESSEDQEGVVEYFFKGVKSKPKLFWYLGSYNPFWVLPAVTYYPNTEPFNTYTAKLTPSISGLTLTESEVLPLIYNNSHIGMLDGERITNDTCSLNFYNEDILQIGKLSGFSGFQEVDENFDVYLRTNLYDRFYTNRIANIYNPNTRLLSGKFNLNLSDIKNLMPNDLIKIKEQYFTWNKIKQFNLTNDELTKVELIQYQTEVKEYPTRYFKYYYCSNSNYKYVFKVDFTNPNPLLGAYQMSINYDYLIGRQKQFYGYFNNIENYTQILTYEGTYYGYSMSEITAEEYENTNYYNWDLDPFLKGLNNMGSSVFRNLFPQFVYNYNGYMFLNQFRGCSWMFGNIPTGNHPGPLTDSVYNFYYYNVTTNDGTKLPNKYVVEYYDINGVQQTATVTNLVDYVIEGAREYSLETEYNGISWEKVQYYDTTNYDPITGLKDPPDDSDLDKEL